MSSDGARMPPELWLPEKSRNKWNSVPVVNATISNYVPAQFLVPMPVVHGGRCLTADDYANAVLFTDLILESNEDMTSFRYINWFLE